MTTDAGDCELASFIDEQCMNRLYEEFILECCIQEHPELRATASEIKWALDDGVGTMLPTMQNDIMLEHRKTNMVLIIDAEYYARTTQTQYNVHTLHSNNLYQVFTYVQIEDEEFGEELHSVS